MRQLLALFITFGLTSFGFGQDLFGNDKEAYVLMPSQTIASGVVRSYQISHSGRLIFYRQVTGLKFDELQQYDSPEQGKWFVYDRTSKSTTALNFPVPISNIMTFGDDRTVYFSGAGEGNPEGFLNLSTGQATPLDKGEARIIYYGDKAYAPFLLGVNKAKDTLGIFYPNGKIATAKLDPAISIGFSIEGNTQNLIIYGYHLEKGAKKASNLIQYKVTLNLSLMTVNYALMDEALDKKFRQEREDEYRRPFTTQSSGDMAYIQLDVPVKVPTANTSRSPGQKTQAPDPKPEESGLIPKSAKLGPAEGRIEFSNQSDIVVYQDAGSLLFRVIQPLDPAAARKLSLDMVKKKLLSKAKQVGLGFLIYGSDNDEVLPGAEGWENKLMPYMKNRDLMNDFNYTFKGGDLANVEDPSGTELGFIVGPGGRAVVYLDGHAKWVPNP